MRSRPRQRTTARDYTVGYGKPPVATRFRPGISGNPKGRPKRQKTDAELLDDILSGPVNVTEAGEPRSITRLEAMFKVHANKAMQGDVRSMKIMVGIMQDLGRPVNEPPETKSITVKLIRPGEQR